MNALLGGPHGQLVALLRYGSARAGSDADFMAVYDVPPPSAYMILGGLDLWATSREELNQYARLLDPVVTEPLLTGKLVAGNSDVIEEALSIAVSSKPNDVTLSNLLRRSFHAYLRASDLATSSVDGASGLSRDYWSSLSFAISYWFYARQYANHWQGILTLEKLTDYMSQPLRELWNEVIEAKRATLPVDTTTLQRWSRHLATIA